MDLGFLSYIDIIFYVLIGLAVLMGFVRGLKKTLFTLITMVIFYVVFFLTITPVSKALWSMEMPWLGPILGNIDASLASFTSFEGSLETILQFALGESIDVTNVSGELVELATGIGIFVIKIIYTILYFTVILLIYKLICLILGAIILGKAGKGESKNHGFGALVGVANGVMAVFIAMIMLGGIMSVTESMVLLVPTDSGDDTTTLSFPSRQGLLELGHSVILLEEEGEGLSDQMLAIIEDTKAMVEAYNNNLFVKLAAKITAPSVVNETEIVPLHLNLFDTILSFEYNEEVVAFRYELGILSEAALVFMDSEFMETNNIGDITGTEIRDIFIALGKSNLIISVMPLGIELAANNFGQELPISVENLYAIDFATELPKVGAIAGALFDILNDAGFIEGEGELEQIEITGTVVRDLFEDMSESQVIVLLVEALLVPMIESEDSEIGAIISIPAGVEWDAELIAIGDILGAIFDQDISFQDLLGEDPMIFLTAAASIDVDLLLDSKLISHTLVNILSGDAGIEGLDFLEIPDGIVWLDDDNLGELRNILVAMQTLVDLIGEGGFEDITIETIAGMTDDQIDDLFGSYVLVATISKMITEIDFGDTPVVIPDDVYDDQDYITATELKAVAKAVALILPDTGTEFEIAAALSMDSADIITFLDSQIIAATVGKLIIDLEVDMLEIPDEVVTSVDVDGLPVEIVEDTEISALLQSLAILELDDFENIEFGAGIIDKFADSTDPDVLDEDIVETFIASKIIHASVSSMIFDLETGASAILNVPTLAVDGNPLVTTVSGTAYLSSPEIVALFKSLYVLDLDSFDDINLEDTDDLILYIDVFLESAILHATISDQVLSIDDAVLAVPYESGDDVPITIRITRAETEYIAASELEAFVDAVKLLDIDNPTEFQAVFSLDDINDLSEQNILLASAIIHATISKTITDFGDTVLVVPTTASDGVTAVRYETGPVGNKTEYLTKDEIIALIEALEVMGVVSIDGFSGALDLGNLFASQVPEDYNENQTTLLASASIHATISKQLLDLGSSILVIPELDISENPVKSVVQTIPFITVEEIKAIINALDVLSGGTVSDVNDFSGEFSLADLATENAKDTLLTSASMHATISERIFDVNDSILIVPDTKQDGLTDLKVETGSVGFEQTFIIQSEIKAMIDALLIMGFSDLSSFSAAFELSEDLFDNASTVFNSSSIQAMFSGRLLNDTGTSLVVPNQFYGTPSDIVIEQTDVTYIDYDELVAFVNALDLLGLDNFSAFSFTPANIFLLASFDGLLASEIMQATISVNILPHAKAENESPAASDMVIPNYFRQTIAVGLGFEVQVQKSELNKLLTSLKMLGMLTFGDGIDAGNVTTIFSDAEERVVFTNSGSIHVTLDNMIKHNANISGSIPDLAKHSELMYNIANLTTKDEIIAFIVAADTLATASSSGDDFTEVTFSFASLLTLSQADQSKILDSMIVRNKITPETELFCQVTPPVYTLVPTDYHGDDTNTFLRKTTFEDIIIHYQD